LTGEKLKERKLPTFEIMSGGSPEVPVSEGVS